jgi:hypothetical protein
MFASNAGVARFGKESITGAVLSPAELAAPARDPPSGLCAPIGDPLPAGLAVAGRSMKSFEEEREFKRDPSHVALTYRSIHDD